MSGSAKFLLLSVLIMSIFLPARAALERNPRVGLKKALLHTTIFNLLYVLGVTYVYPRLL